MTNIKSAFGDFLARHLEKHYSQKAKAREAKKVKYLKKPKSPTMQITKIHLRDFASARFLAITLCFAVLVPSLITIVHAETDANPDATDLSSLTTPDPEPEEADDLEVVPATNSELDTTTPEAGTAEADSLSEPQSAPASLAMDQPMAIAQEEVWVTIQGVGNDYSGSFPVPKGKKLEDSSRGITAVNYVDQLATYHANLRFKNFHIVDPSEDVDAAGLLNKTFDKDTMVRAVYELDVTVRGVEGKVTMTYPGTITSEVQGLMRKKQMPANVYMEHYWYEYPDKNQKVNLADSHTMTKHTELDVVYYVLVKMNGVSDHEATRGVMIDQGSQLSEAIRQIPSLNDTSKRTFSGKFQESGVSASTVVNENKTYTPLFNIDVTINGRKVTLAEGKKLKDHPYYNTYKNRSGFKEFRKADGSKVDDNTELHEHTSVTAIYTIKVTVPSAFGQGGKTVFEMESGDNMNTKVPSEVLSKLKAADSRGRTFSRLVDSRGNTVTTNEALYEDTTVYPKYNNAITVARRGDDGLPIDAGKLSLQVEEGTSLNSSNASNINNWVNQQIQTLKSEGKTNPKLSYYTVNGRRIDPASYTSLDHNDQVVAVFTSDQKPAVDPGPPSSPEPTPTEPETTPTPTPQADPAPTPSATPTSDGTALKVPNTAGTPADFDFAPILLIFLSAIGFLGVKIYRRHKRFFSSKT